MTETGRRWVVGFVVGLGGLVNADARAAAPATKPAETLPPVVEKFDDGSPRVRYASDDKGVKTGPYEEYFPGGAVKVRGTYAAGKKSGLWRTFDEAGKVVESAPYRDDQLDGPYTWTTPGGKAGYRASYRLGELAGPVTVLDDAGKTARVLKYPRPLAKIREAWDTLYPKAVEPPKFVEEPSGKPPYKAGKLDPETLEQALKVAKLYRYLSGLPWQHLALDPKANVKAQHGAVILTKIGSLTHTPAKPDDMDDAFFKLAYDGCNQSNLHQGQPNVVSGLRGFMDDSDPSNIARVGHRLWVLKPGLKRVGFGFAYAAQTPDKEKAWGPRGFTTMHVNDGSRDVPGFDYFAFPGEGYYPLPLVEAHYAWSLHLNAKGYPVPATHELKVTVQRLDEHFQPEGTPSPAQVVSVIEEKTTRGWVVVIFKPDLKPPMKAGRYWVDVTGIKTLQGKPRPFGYVVDLVPLEGADVTP